MGAEKLNTSGFIFRYNTTSFPDGRKCHVMRRPLGLFIAHADAQ